MANTQSQFGFQHVGYVSGYAPDYQLATRAIQSSYGTAIYFGDPVVKSASSPYISVGLGTGSLTAIEGVFYGCEYTDANGNTVRTPWWPGTSQKSDAKAFIVNSPGAIFKAAALLTAVPTTAIGQNIGWSTGAGGTTLGGGFSTFTVDQSLLTTGAVGPFQVYGMYNGIGNGSDTTTNYNWVLVTFNNQRFRVNTGVA
jgi:hypothetical protein